MAQVDSASPPAWPEGHAPQGLTKTTCGEFWVDASGQYYVKTPDGHFQAQTGVQEGMTHRTADGFLLQLRDGRWVVIEMPDPPPLTLLDILMGFTVEKGSKRKKRRDETEEGKKAEDGKKAAP